MRRILIVALSAALLTTTAWVVRRAAAGSTRTAPEHGLRMANPAQEGNTGARSNFWHPDLVTLHLWVWYPNPAGLYSGTNPSIQPFNRG